MRLFIALQVCAIPATAYRFKLGVIVAVVAHSAANEVATIANLVAESPLLAVQVCVYVATTGAAERDFGI